MIPLSGHGSLALRDLTKGNFRNALVWVGESSKKSVPDPGIRWWDVCGDTGQIAVLCGTNLSLHIWLFVLWYKGDNEMSQTR